MIKLQPLNLFHSQKITNNDSDTLLIVFDKFYDHKDL